MRVLITGAAGQIGYALAPAIAKGDMFGPHQEVILHLLDLPAAAKSLDGVKDELEDLASPLLKGVVVTTNVEEACVDVDVAIMVGGHPFRPNVNRDVSLVENAAIFRSHAISLQNLASPDVKIVVVANPANTNAYVMKEAAPRIPPEHITCLTRLDHNRALSQVARKANVSVSAIRNVVIWGNRSHSSHTQYADVHYGTIGAGLSREPIRRAVGDDAYFDTDFVAAVQERGFNIQRKRGLSCATSAASAVCDHVRSWLLGTPAGEWVSMGVVSDGSYGIMPGLVYSYPVTCKRGRWQIVQGLDRELLDWGRLQASMQELLDERDVVVHWMQEQA